LVSVGLLKTIENLLRIALDEDDFDLIQDLCFLISNMVCTRSCCIKMLDTSIISNLFDLVRASLLKPSVKIHTLNC